MVFAVLSPLAVPFTPHYVELAFTLALMSGVIMLALGLLGFGTLVNFVSQLRRRRASPPALGVFILLVPARQLSRHRVAAERLRRSGGARRSRTSATRRPWVALVAAATVAVGAVSHRVLPRIPPMLAAMVLGQRRRVFPQPGARRGAHRPARRSVPCLARCRRSSRPDLSLATLQNLLPAAVAVALVSLTQALLDRARHRAQVGAAARQQPGVHRAGPRQRRRGVLLGLSDERVGEPLRHQLRRRRADADGGDVRRARSWSLVLLAVAPLVAYLPIAVVAGHPVPRRLEPDRPAADPQDSRHQPRRERRCSPVTFFATLLLDLEFAILVGVLVSLVLYLNRSSHPIMRSLVPDPRHTERKMTEVEDSLVECPQLKILRIEGSIYFGAVGHVERHLDTLREHSPGQKHLLLMSKSINTVDMAGAELLVEEARRRRDGRRAALFLQPEKTGRGAARARRLHGRDRPRERLPRQARGDRRRVHAARPIDLRAPAARASSRSARACPSPRTPDAPRRPRPRRPASRPAAPASPGSRASRPTRWCSPSATVSRPVSERTRARATRRASRR